MNPALEAKGLAIQERLVARKKVQMETQTRYEETRKGFANSLPGYFLFSLLLTLAASARIGSLDEVVQAYRAFQEVAAERKRKCATFDTLVKEGTLEVLADKLRDQLYFAIRYGLARVMAGQEKEPFLILDDPFAHFDGDRLCTSTLHRKLRHLRRMLPSSAPVRSSAFRRRVRRELRHLVGSPA
ncbi:MAG: hypothetical protein HYZ53_02505 [Planctomycetes bacterium]|nr:hypothetical protein [Planctomycetota bacterium]